MSTESDSLLHIIETAAAGPTRVAGDAGSVENRPLTELIALHRYLSDGGAGDGTGPGSSPRRGLRFSKILPPGAV